MCLGSRMAPTVQSDASMAGSTRETAPNIGSMSGAGAAPTSPAGSSGGLAASASSGAMPASASGSGSAADPSCPPGETTPTWMKWVTRISLVVGIIALIATVYFVGPTAIITHLKAIGWFFIVIIGLEILSSVFDATAVFYMASGPGRPTWKHAVVAQLVGRGVNSITPGGNLGEALKVGLLSQRCSPKRIIAAVMYVTLMIGVVSFAFIAIGTGATAFLFDVPKLGMLLMLVGAVLAIAIAVGIYLLLRRGMLTTLVNTISRLHIISKTRRDKWNKTLGEIDERLRGQDVAHRRKALFFICLSQTLQKGIAFLVVYAAGYTLSPGQFLALVSAGVLLGWVSTIVPMGLGISEGGNVALFSLIGAPAALGLALSISRRVNQIVFATIGFIVLAGDKAGTHIHGRVRTKWPAKAPVKGVRSSMPAPARS